MTEDARFEDGGETPLYLGAMDPEDLSVLSALCQDAVLPANEILWKSSERRLALLLNRFRWERSDGRGGPERVQSVLVIENVLRVASQGIDRKDPDLVLSLLEVRFAPDGAAGGEVELLLAGDGAIKARVEALELTLKDVTRPYTAPSRKAPRHPD